MTRALEHSYGPTASRGIALIVGLVILAILSMIGVAAFSISDAGRTHGGQFARPHARV